LGLFGLWKNQRHDKMFGISELLTVSSMGIVWQLLQNLQQLKKIGHSDFSMKQLNELVGISDRLLFPNSLDDSCNFLQQSLLSVISILETTENTLS